MDWTKIPTRWFLLVLGLVLGLGLCFGSCFVRVVCETPPSEIRSILSAVECDLVAVSGSDTEHDFHFLLVLEHPLSCCRGVGRLTEEPTARSIRWVDAVAMARESFGCSVLAIENDFFTSFHCHKTIERQLI